jgi:hypothetical protein
LEKKNVFPKKYVEFRTFDGTILSLLAYAQCTVATIFTLS